MEPRKSLPWILSMAVHAALILVPVGVIVSPLPKAVQERGLDVAIAASPGATSDTSGALDARGVGTVASGMPPTPPGAADLPEPGKPSRRVPAAPLPRGSTTLPPGVAAIEGPARGNAVAPSAPGGVGDIYSVNSLPLVSPQDVLSDLPSSVPGPGATAEGLQRGGAEIAWQGTPRKVIRWLDPQFPAVLSATGQEVECDAQITVAPSGVIVHVEITRSSGYTEIDASVEAALRDNLFSRVSGRTDTVALVKYRFRPEKQD